MRSFICETIEIVVLSVLRINFYRLVSYLEGNVLLCICIKGIEVLILCINTFQYIQLYCVLL